MLLQKVWNECASPALKALQTWFLTLYLNWCMPTSVGARCLVPLYIRSPMHCIPLHRSGHVAKCPYSAQKSVRQQRFLPRLNSMTLPLEGNLGSVMWCKNERIYSCGTSRPDGPVHQTPSAYMNGVVTGWTRA